MKIRGVVGEPASGKSTVMRNLISGLGPGEVEKEGLVVVTRHSEDKVIVAGIYDDQVFSGTDRTSKACGPKFREWILGKNQDSGYDDWVFYWEGERFSNNKFLEFFYQECSDVTIYYLEADNETLDTRNANRSGQNETWRKGMKTRMLNLKNKYPLIPVQQGFSLVDG